jgi:D-lactate dehydrogenase (cytochrome)
MCNSDRNVHQHGTLKDWVISLVLVLADGTVVETNRPGRYTAKYNLTNLVIGSRGTLALVTEAVLRLTTPPQNLHIGMMAFRSLQDGLAAAMKLWDSRHSLEAIKFVDAACMQAIKRSGLTNEEVKEMPTLIVKFTGPLQRVNEQIGLFTQLCYQHSAVGLEVTNDRDRIEAIWGLRKSLGNALGMLRARPTPSQIYLQSEVTVPSLHMLELAQVEETLQSFAKQRLWFCGSVIDVGIGMLPFLRICVRIR